MADPTPFWEKPLAELDRGQWEALCDGCGRCCLHKLEDEETGLDRKNGMCIDYAHRKKRVTDCVVLNQGSVGTLDWLPESCAYRLRSEGKPLPGWHYLISGSRETVHEAGQSTRGWTVSEADVEELEDHVIDRPL